MAFLQIYKNDIARNTKSHNYFIYKHNLGVANQLVVVDCLFKYLTSVNQTHSRAFNIHNQQCTLI